VVIKDNKTGMANSYEGKRNKIWYAVLLNLLIIFIGISGYSIIEGVNFLDALYMTIITVTTVGFGEVKELSDVGKVFTISLIITSIGAFAYSLSILTSLFVEGELFYLIRGYRRKSSKDNMENHVIICGYGRNGRQAAKELIAHNNRFVIIDSNQELVVENTSKLMRFVEGDATQDETLISAGIMKAKALITSLPDDAANLFVVLTARSLNPALKIVSRASAASSEKKLRIAGVNNVIMPEKVGGAHMATIVAHADVVEFLNHLSVHGDAPANLEEIVCSGMHESYLNKTIYELGVRKKTGANIVGFKTPEGDYIVNPDPNTKVIQNSKLFVLGTPEQIANMKDMLGSE